MRTKHASHAAGRRLRSQRRTMAQEGVPEGQDGMQEGRRSGPPTGTPPEGQPVAGTGIVEAQATPGPRRRRGRPRAGTLDWSQVEGDLGVMSDAEVAQRLGVTRHSVRYQRDRRGIPALRGAEVRRQQQASPLQDRIVEHLRAHGAMSVVDVARGLRVTEPCVCAALRKLSAAGIVVKDGPPRTCAPWRLVGAP